MSYQYRPYTGPIITPTSAKQSGLKRYFLGRPCKSSHISERYLSTGWCCECSRQTYQRTKGVTPIRVPRRRKCTEAELAYAAGFFDGEGHIAITFRKARTEIAGKDKYARYTLQCAVTQTRAGVIDWFADKFGGGNTAARHKRSYDDQLYKRFGWSISSAAAMEFLILIRPWLIVKAAEADVAIEFQRTMNRHTGPLPTPDETIAFRAECFRKIREIRRNQCQAPA